MHALYRCILNINILAEHAKPLHDKYDTQQKYGLCQSLMLTMIERKRNTVMNMLMVPFPIYNNQQNETKYSKQTEKGISFSKIMLYHQLLKQQ